MTKSAFNKIPKLLKEFPQAVEAGLTACGMTVKSDAVSLVPVDTGELKGDLGYQVVIEDKKTGEGYVKIGNNILYAVYVEFGTGIYAENGDGRKSPWTYYYNGNKGEKGQRVTMGQKPQSFLRSALDGRKKDLKDIFDKAVVASLKGSVL